jgi:ABC-type polysaccharide/polyol phosphate export permease
MFWVFQRSGWSVIAAFALLTSATFCWSFYRDVRRQSQEATTDKERLDANWPLMQLAVAVISVLGLCLMILKHLYLVKLLLLESVASPLSEVLLLFRPTLPKPCHPSIARNGPRGSQQAVN